MIRILFVCTGNICRSPTAEGVFRFYVHQLGLKNNFHIDSAGLLDYHEGEAPDKRSQDHALKRGYDLSKIKSRPIEESDFSNFDHLIAMDKSHLKAMIELCPKPLRPQKNIKLLLDYSKKWTGQDIPDPYFGGGTGFDLVLDMLEESCRFFLETLNRK